MKTSKSERTEEPAKAEPMVIVTFPKPPQDKFGASAKIIRMRTIMNFVAKVRGFPMHDDEFSFQMISPAESDDGLEGAKWFRDNVIRYVDIDKDADDRVDRLMAKYDEIDPEHTHRVTIGLIRLQAQEIYMPLSVWRVE